MFSFPAAKQSFKEADVFFIFDHFDAFFSVIENSAKLQMNTLILAIDILYRTTDKLGELLDTYLKQETLDRQDDFLNLTKMVMYLLVSTIRAVDTFVKNNTPAKSGRKSKKNADDLPPEFANYGDKRYSVLIQISNFIQMQIDKLWPMSIVEEDFIK